MAEITQEGVGMAKTGHRTCPLPPRFLPAPIPWLVSAQEGLFCTHSSCPRVPGNQLSLSLLLSSSPAASPSCTCGLGQLDFCGSWLRPQSHNQLGLLIEDCAVDPLHGQASEMGWGPEAGPLGEQLVSTQPCGRVGWILDLWKDKGKPWARCPLWWQQ